MNQLSLQSRSKVKLYLVRFQHMSGAAFGSGLRVFDILLPQRDFELLSFLVIVLAVKNRKWKPGISMIKLFLECFVCLELKWIW